MDHLLEKLITILQQCEELYGRMLPVIEQEKKAALDSDPEHLSQINHEKSNLLARLKALDNDRSHLLHQIALRLDASAEQLTLSALTAYAAPAYQSRLTSLSASLRQLLFKVNRANVENRLLVAHCLNLVKNTLNFFSHWTGAAVVYGASGSLNDAGRGHGRLLSNVV